MRSGSSAIQHYFAMMLVVAFKNCSIVVPIQFCTDGNVFNLRRLHAKTKVQCQVIRELLFADDCALLAHTENEAQELFNRFSNAARHFGLTVSRKKTEVLLQPANRQNYTTPGIKASNVELKVVDKFCYLGSVLSSNTVVDDDINSRLSKANVALGWLSKRLWCNHGISTATKVAVYRAAILSSLLYGQSSGQLFSS